MKAASDRILAYVRHRQEQKAANATINRELAALKRMFRLGEKAGNAMRAVLVAVLIVAGSSPACAQSTDDLRSLKQDIDALKEGQTAIQKELQEIKTLLRGRPGAAGPPPEVMLTVGDGPSKGSATAKLTLVEFTDYQ